MHTQPFLPQLREILLRLLQPRPITDSRPSHKKTSESRRCPTCVHTMGATLAAAVGDMPSVTMLR